MTTDNDKSLQYLKLKIDEIETESKKHQHVIINESCFDISLFSPSKADKGYQSYLDEINNNHQKLSELIKTNESDTHDYLEQISYLAEKIVNQITALSRELATHKSRVKNKKNIEETLFDKHAKHLDYLRRLKVSKYEMEEQFEKNRSSINKENITHINQRIYRCQQAIAEIEKEMENT